MLRGALRRLACASCSAASSSSSCSSSLAQSWTAAHVAAEAIGVYAFSSSSYSGEMATSGRYFSSSSSSSSSSSAEPAAGRIFSKGGEQLTARPATKRPPPKAGQRFDLCRLPQPPQPPAFWNGGSSVVASRKPAIKRPKPHQWRFCDPNVRARQGIECQQQKQQQQEQQ
jgi:hypothetical protein